MRPYLKKPHHNKGLEEWLKVYALSSNPSTLKKEKEEEYCFNFVVFLPESPNSRLITIKEHSTEYLTRLFEREVSSKWRET
jgi:hypothetical protein